MEREVRYSISSVERKLPSYLRENMLISLIVDDHDGARSADCERRFVEHHVDQLVLKSFELPSELLRGKLAKFFAARCASQIGNRLDRSVKLATTALFLRFDPSLHSFCCS